MPPASRSLLQSSPDPIPVDSDVVVILAALLCALICVMGLALVARCAWLRRPSLAAPAPPPTKGLKKKALKALPVLSFGAAAVPAALSECPICLAEFEAGDELRVLPQCGHGFHVGCVDVWLVAHASCPSCRRVLVVDGEGDLASAAPAVAAVCCERCGASSAAVDDDRFLP